MGFPIFLITSTDPPSWAELLEIISWLTSALVFNQNVGPQGGGDNVRKFYVAVWLSETGTNQTQGATITEGTGESAPTYTNPDKTGFFAGNVTFLSAQGSEVSATFSSYARVETVTTEPGTGA